MDCNGFCTFEELDKDKAGDTRAGGSSLSRIRAVDVVRFNLREWPLFPLDKLGPLLLPSLTCSSQNTGDDLGASQTIVIGGNGVRHPGWIRISVNDTDGRNVMKATLVKHDFIFQRIEADNKIGLPDWLRCQLFVKAWNLIVIVIHHLHLAVTKNLLAVGQTSRCPSLEDVISLCELRSIDNASFLTVSCANKQDQTSALGNLFNNLARTSQISSGHIQRDDVNTVSHTEDVFSISGIPQGSSVAEVRLGSEKEFEGDVGGFRGVGDHGVRFVGVRHERPNVLERFF